MISKKRSKALKMAHRRDYDFMTWDSPTLSIQGRDDVVGVEPDSSDTWSR